MKRIQTLLFVSLGLAVGFGAGVKYHAHYSDIAEQNLRLSEERSRADVALRALKPTHTNTVAFLERNLDIAVSILGSIV